MAHQPLVGQGLLIIEASRSHSNTRYSVGILWMSDQPDAVTSTEQHTTLTRDGHSCSRRDSNLQSHQLIARRPTPYSCCQLFKGANVLCFRNFCYDFIFKRWFSGTSHLFYFHSLLSQLFLLHVLILKTS